MQSRTRKRRIDGFAPVGQFVPTGPADVELEWFFTMAESDMGARSNYAVIRGEPPAGSFELRAEAARARRTILDWLVAIGDPHAGVLQTAYTARPWPLALREALGRATGVVVRLGSAEVGLPDPEAERTVVDLRTARRLADTLSELGTAVVAALELRARVLLRTAFLAYVRERGGPERPRIRGVW
jgi:hypothetical protein